MAFGGAAVFDGAGSRTGQSRYEILEVTGLTLGAYVATPPARGNADTGVLSSNRGAIDAVPANTQSVPTEWGPGQDNWSQTDVDAITPVLQDLGDNATRLIYTKALVANVNPAPSSSSITNNNVEVTIANKGAGASGALELRLILEHTVVR